MAAKHKEKMLLEIRKFGLSYCDLPTMLDNVNKLLRVLTLNINNKYKKRIPIYFHILTIISAVAYFYVFLVSASWFIVNRCIKNGDVIRAIIIFSLCIASEIGNAKFAYLYYYRDIVRKIVQKSLDYDESIIPGSRLSKNILKSTRKAKIRAIVFWIIIMANGVFYISKSILTPGRHFMDDLYTIYGLEPIEVSPNYEMGYILMMVSVWFLCYVPVNVTAFLIVVAGYIEGQMLALSEELHCIYPDAEEYYHTLNYSVITEGSLINANFKYKVLNDLIKVKLHDIIKKHAMNMRLLHLLEKVFRGAIALEFFLLIVGLIAELLGGLKNTYVEIPYAFIQVAMDCWTGQRVLDASAAFEAAVYACNWENFDVSNMKIVLMMLGSAQKTMKLSAGGVLMLSFSSLMSVVRSIYSTYTALQSTIK